ncbi:MAG: o-succinylbenzoate synthase [Firmicutes bacterium]|nr:o-succinylbenzoate synthase [Bacillota bacterium]
MEQAIWIERVELFEVEIPYKIPFSISGGTALKRKSLILRLTDLDGYQGYGESAPFEQPFYSSETIETAKVALVEYLIPKVVGQGFASIEEFNRTLHGGVRGNNFAKASLETAYWDLVAKRNGLTFVELFQTVLRSWGVAEEHLLTKDQIESGVSVGIPQDYDLKTLQAWVDEYVDEGYRRVKLKIKPGWDVKPTFAVRKQIGSHFALWLDGNGAYNFGEHLEVFKELDEAQCLFYEQPLGPNDLWEHSKLCKAVVTPICLDESLKDARTALAAVEMEAAQVWNIKLQRMGGLWEALQAYKLAMESGIKLWGGTMPESGIGAIPMIALASFSGFVYPSDIEPSKRWYESGRDLFEISMDEQGKITVPNFVGIEFPEKKLAEIGRPIVNSYKKINPKEGIAN